LRVQETRPQLNVSEADWQTFEESRCELVQTGGTGQLWRNSWGGFSEPKAWGEPWRLSLRCRFDECGLLGPF